MKRVAFIVPYFGRWPAWFEFFLLSVETNPTIDWFFYCDQAPPPNSPPNAHFLPTNFEEYWQRATDKLGLPRCPSAVYKLCDLKPFFGFLHEHELRDFAYYGFTDIDVIYGDLRSFLTDSLLTRQMISALATRICGHFALFKNTRQNREAGFRIPNWSKKLCSRQDFHLDEGDLTRLYGMHRSWRNIYRQTPHLLKIGSNCVFCDHFATPFVPWPWENGAWCHPTQWYWRAGKLTNNVDGAKQRLYLHFMNWKSARYLHPMWGAQAAWSGKNICQVSLAQARNGFRITTDGFLPLTECNETASHDAHARVNWLRRAA